MFGEANFLRTSKGFTSWTSPRWLKATWCWVSNRLSPSLLSTGGSVIIKDDLFYLSKILNWSNWNYPGTGLRQSLKDELEIFKTFHQSEIESTLDQESWVYMVACLALSKSVSIIKALVKCIDNIATYRGQFQLEEGSAHIIPTCKKNPDGDVQAQTGHP
jgi:hypothetical protein